MSLATSEQPMPVNASEEATQLQQLLQVSTIVLEQARDLVKNHLTSDEQLTTHSQHVPGSTIGKNLRHARDHFVALCECIAADAPRTLNYDERKRNTPMEGSLRAAEDALNEAIAQLARVVPKARMDAPITLKAVTPFPQTVQTSFGRELWFCSLHAVHHWSAVRIIAGELGIKLDESFGFAPSTLVHQGTDAPLGKAKI